MKRVLLVDDEAAIRTLLSAVLKLHGFEVNTAASAAEGIERLHAEQVELVITDMRMEYPTAGFDVARAASRMEPRPAIAILTAFPVNPEEWRDAGADALFVKGGDVASMVARLETMISKRGVQSAAAGNRNRWRIV